MRTNEAAERLREYSKHMDERTFLNSYMEASRKYGDNFELILQDMEMAKNNITKTFNQNKKDKNL